MSGSAQARYLAVEGLDTTAEAAVHTIPKPDELSWWDWAVFLLHTAAEIEHALMAQYLYAAYSLADADFTGAAVPADAAARTARWRATITAIAREEMAHLLTEQNLLRFIGGPLNFERQDFPFRSALYPFPGYYFDPKGSGSLWGAANPVPGGDDVLINKQCDNPATSIRY